MRKYYRSETEQALKIVQTYQRYNNMELIFNTKYPRDIVKNKTMYKELLSQRDSDLSKHTIKEFNEFTTQFDIQYSKSCAELVQSLDENRYLDEVHNKLMSYKGIGIETYNRFEQVLILFWIYKHSNIFWKILWDNFITK